MSAIADFAVALVVSALLAFGGWGCDARAAHADELTPPGGAERVEPTRVRTEPRADPEPGPASTDGATAPVPANPRTLTGRDVYRINCQGCHGPDGAGTAQAPSLVAPARTLAGDAEAEAHLRERLARGGDRMPALPHLTRPEVDALLGYLGELGGAEPTAGPVVAAPTGLALGERIYRSNCASCHEPGTGSWSGMMCRPASLAGATRRFSEEQVKNLLDVGVGPMPAFGHLTTVERDALWAYLETLPAEPGARPTMGQMCPMVRAAMDGRPTRGMMGRGMMGGGGTGRGMMGGGMMGRGMMGGRMMRGGMGCPMMRTDPPGTERGDASSRLPACCR